MSQYSLPRLGDLQVKILMHMLSCDSPESVSHISKEVNALQPVVFQSTNRMIDEEILAKTAIANSNKKQLSLTDKGLAIAILMGLKHKKLDEVFNKSDESEKLHSIEFFDFIKQTIEPKKQKTLLKKALEYMVIHGWYDQGAKLDQNERLGLFNYLIPQMADTSEVRDIVNLMDKFGIDKVEFGRMLMDKLRETVTSTSKVLNAYQRYTKTPYSREQIISLAQSLYEDIEVVASEIRTNKHKKDVKEIKDLVKRGNTTHIQQ